MIQRRLTTGLLALALLALSAGSAEAQHFGRNKVQYRAFDFKVIKTEHFDVYFYPQEEEAALDAARMIERGYARLSRLLQHEFKERKPVILYASHADFQQTNALYGFIDEGTGGATEPLKDRIVMPFTGSYADFEHVLVHELVHAFQFDVIFQRGVMTDASPFGARLPLWFMEGMAEYLSIGHIDAHTASWLRDASMAGYLRDIAEMSQRDDYLSYRFGQSLWAYIGSKWGDEVVGILLQKAPRIGIVRAFESTLGISMEELSNEWVASVRSIYLPQMTQYQSPARIARRLTDHERLEDPWFLAPALSADGRYLAFTSQRDGFSFDLFLADAKTGKVIRKLIEGAQENFESLRYMNSSSAFSPDGRFLAFSAQTGGRDALYIYDIDSGRVTKKLTWELNGVANPSWSPDGERIVFTGIDGGISDLYITDLDGELERLTDDRYADLLPAWSPDGRKIAFSSERGAETDFDRLVYGNLKISVYDLGTGKVEVLPEQDAGKNVNAVWSPDGRELVWISDRTGINNLYLYEVESRELSRITDFLSGAIAITPLSPALAWSNEGMVFLYFESAGYNLYALDDPRTLPRTPVAKLPAVAAAAPDDERGPATPVGDYIPIYRVENEAVGSIASFYRSDDGFRPSAMVPPDQRDPEGPVSVLAMMEQTRDALPDADDFAIQDYELKFTPDMIGRPTIGAQVGGYYGNGVFGGSFITLSDMLGNHNILLAGNINGSFSDANVFAGYNFLKTRANLGVAVQQVPLYRYFGGGAVTVPDDRGGQRDVIADVFMRDVIRTASGVMSYPFSTFRRLELGASATSLQRDLLYRGFDPLSGEPYSRDDDLLGLSFVEPSAALVFDNALFGWTGPIRGRRFRLQASRTFGDIGYTEALADFRNYYNISQRAVFASRVVALTRFGRDADRFSLFWGGPYFIRGYDGDTFEFDGECRDFASEGSLSPCPIRDQLIGSSAAFINLEMRVPVITELQLGFLGNFPPVDAVAFFDGGLAWDNAICAQTDLTQPDECAPGASQDVSLVWDRKPGQDPFLVREPLFSYGLGLRLNVFYTILRLDYAWPVNRPDRGGVFSVSFGPSF